MLLFWNSRWCFWISICVISGNLWMSRLLSGSMNVRSFSKRFRGWRGSFVRWLSYSFGVFMIVSRCCWMERLSCYNKS